MCVGRCADVHHKTAGWVRRPRSVISAECGWGGPHCGRLLTCIVKFSGQTVPLIAVLVRPSPLPAGPHDTPCCCSDSLELAVAFFWLTGGAKVQSLLYFPCMKSPSDWLLVRLSFPSRHYSLSSSVSVEWILGNMIH